jgi:hypothetical protein
MKVYAAVLLLTLAVTAFFYTAGDFASAQAALLWAAQMVLLFANGHLLMDRLRDESHVVAGLQVISAAVIAAVRLAAASEPTLTAIGLGLIFGAGALRGWFGSRDAEPTH